MLDIYFPLGWRRELSFTTRLSPEECARRLEQGIPHLNRPAWRGPELEDGLYGYLKPPIFVLWQKTSVSLVQPSWGHPGQVFFYGRLVPSGGNTTIRGYFDTNSSARLFALFWVVAVLLFGLGFLATEISQKGITGVPLGPLGTFLFLLVGGIAFFAGSTWLGTRDEPEVIQFLQTTLEAAPPPPPPPS